MLGDGLYNQSHTDKAARLEAAFAVASLQEEGGAAYWRKVCAPLFDVSPMRDWGFSAQIWFAGPLVFCRVACGGSALRRTLRHISTSRRFLLAVRVSEGRILGEAADRPFDIRAGEIAVHDYGSEFKAVLFPSILEAVFVPRASDGAQTAEADPVRILRQGGTGHAGMGRDFDEVFARLRRGDKQIPVSALGGLADPLSIVAEDEYRAIDERSFLRDLNRQKITTYIELNLGAKELSASRIVAQFGVSRATLYRLFEDAGGVRTYICDRRLFRALYEIASTPYSRGQIQRASDSWGFSSGTHFNRAVRRWLSAAPGAIFHVPFRERRSAVPRSEFSAGMLERGLIRSA